MATEVWHNSIVRARHLTVADLSIGATCKALIATLLCSAVLLLSLCSAAAASDRGADLAATPPQRVLFVASKDTSIYRQIVTAGQSVVAGENSAVVIADQTTESALRTELARFAPALVVTVGTAAAQLAYPVVFAADSPAAKPPLLLSTLLTRSAYQVFAERYVATANRSDAVVVVQFLDQPLQRQLHLAALVMPEAERIGLMVGPSTALGEEQISRLAAELGKPIAPVYLSATDNPIRVLEPALAASEVFVPLADSRQFNLATSRWILQLSYRYRRPVVGYSASYADAGAVAAVYTSAEDVAAQLAATLSQWQREGLPEQSAQRPPQQFSISLNHAAAAALDIPLADQSYYRRELEKSDSGAAYELD